MLVLYVSLDPLLSEVCMPLLVEPVVPNGLDVLEVDVALAVLQVWDPLNLLFEHNSPCLRLDVVLALHALSVGRAIRYHRSMVRLLSMPSERRLALQVNQGLLSD